MPDNVIAESAAPAQIITAYDHSDALLRIDAGDSVVLLPRRSGRRRGAAAAADQHGLRHLRQPRGRSGNQTAPLGANGEIGGARQYVSATAPGHDPDHPGRGAAEAILRLSNTPLIAPAHAAAGVDRRGDRIRAAHADSGRTAAQLRHSRRAAGGHALHRGARRRSRCAALRRRGLRAGRRLYADLHATPRWSGISATRRVTQSPRDDRASTSAFSLSLASTTPKPTRTDWSSATAVATRHQCHLHRRGEQCRRYRLRGRRSGDCRAAASNCTKDFAVETADAATG